MVVNKGGRPKTDVGAWGRLQTVPTKGGRWIARGRVRDMRGKLVQRSRVGDTPEEARAAVREALADEVRAAEGADITPDTLFEEVAKLFLDDTKRGQAATTYDRYNQAMRKHVLPELGKLPLRKVTPRRAQVLFNQLDDAGYAVETIKGIRSVISGTMAIATTAGAVPSNPAKSVRLKRGESAYSEIALTDADSAKLLELARADKRIAELEVYDFIVCMLATGCRISEILGLRWQDVSLGSEPRDCYLRIRKNAVFVKGRGIVLQDGKTKASQREIGMIPELREVMLRRAKHPGNHENRPVFPIGVDDRHRDPSTMRELLRPLYAQIPALSGVKQPTHIYRKTVATRLFDQGASAAAVADLLGHSTVTLAQNVYAKRHKRSEAATLSALEFAAGKPAEIEASDDEP